ncbi:DUF2889 domain-containing protein [Noviherbaspirillum sedimenti]|nr:DUF2889 domain-containing protein [Noviherbaspirillum sedimenti]
MITETSESVERRLIHQRRVTCSGFARSDGTWDIEGHLIDTVTESVELVTGTIAPGEPMHEMRLCITIDLEMRIIDAQARTLHGPYPVCGEINATYRSLIGLQIKPGFTQLVKRQFRDELGCTHLNELLPPMATAAFQLLLPIWAQMGKPFNMVGGCHALRFDGDIVRKYFPDQFRAPD